MIYQIKLRKRRLRKIRSLLGWLLCMLLLPGNVFSTSNVVNDLVLLPANKSKLAKDSILMDVVKVNGRMVAVGERGHILISENDCDGWTQVDVPVSVTLTAVYFPTTKKGWAVGHEGVVLHTEDAGKTWEKQLDGVKIGELIYNKLKHMIKDKTAYLESKKAEITEAEREDMIGELEDLDFFLRDAEAAIEEGPVQPIMDVWFKNEKEGIIIGAFGMILGTANGGKNWMPLLDRIEKPYGYHYYGIARSGDNLFIAGEAGSLHRSQDFGKTWQRLESPYDGTFFGIVGSPEGEFITAFGLRGNIVYSYDKGNTWQHQRIGNSSLSGGVWLFDGSFCVFANDGSVYISLDKAKTFDPFPMKYPGSIAAVESSKAILIVVGLKGISQIDIKNEQKLQRTVE